MAAVVERLAHGASQQPRDEDQPAGAERGGHDDGSGHAGDHYPAADKPHDLAGDAAHVHSSIGGQGMNTGIQDAHNLAWKLALVMRGVAPNWWLDTYESERRRIAADVIAWFKAQTPKGRGYQTNINQALRDHVQRSAHSAR